MFVAIANAGVADATDTKARGQSALASLKFISERMDRFHRFVFVREDSGSPGNHFHVVAKIGDEIDAVTVDEAWAADTHSGATAIRCHLADFGINFGGSYFMNGALSSGSTIPQANFGVVNDAGVVLTGSAKLAVHLKGAKGGEVVEFFVAGVGRDPKTGKATSPFPDSSKVIKRKFKLTKSWKRYTIPLKGKNLSYVLGGFGWSASVATNGGAVEFFLDDVRFELTKKARKKRLASPRFVQSFVTEPQQSSPGCVGDFDLRFRQVAFSYDNALALIAFLAEGSPSSVARARHIADAFLYAQAHDRWFTNGAIRDAYAAGDVNVANGWIVNGKAGTTAVPGMIDPTSGKFDEVEQAGMSTGNLAWVMLALVSAQDATGDDAYLQGAISLGNVIRSFRRTTGTFQGFLGGLDTPETTPTMRIWASTEHNIDLSAAFTRLGAATADPSWLDDAAHARAFVEAMWDPTIGGYRAGTIDPETRNELVGQLPLDVQAWAALALGNALTLHPQLLDAIANHHEVAIDGFEGVDFNDDKDVIWFEGTAQYSCALAIAGNEATAAVYRSQLRTAQATSGFGDGGGLVAASHDCGSTGFGFHLVKRLHVGATAWNVFAQLRFNPFTGTTIP
ncbi:MAG: hypothetical protein IT459_17440 [Planctomycetes bacterium]|nr:hypothetical protein [Planctomycetota bacterium]